MSGFAARVFASRFFAGRFFAACFFAARFFAGIFSLGFFRRPVYGRPVFRRPVYGPVTFSPPGGLMSVGGYGELQHGDRPGREGFCERFAQAMDGGFDGHDLFGIGDRVGRRGAIGLEGPRVAFFGDFAGAGKIDGERLGRGGGIDDLQVQHILAAIEGSGEEHSVDGLWTAAGGGVVCVEFCQLGRQVFRGERDDLVAEVIAEQRLGIVGGRAV